MENLVIGGFYEHYKGQRYRVHGIVKHSETLEDLVYYECLYENKLGKMWVRPKAMFLEDITVEGKTRPRFRHLKNEAGSTH
jgi:hypothetical protein